MTKVAAAEDSGGMEVSKSGTQAYGSGSDGKWVFFYGIKGYLLPTIGIVLSATETASPLQSSYQLVLSYAKSKLDHI